MNEVETLIRHKNNKKYKLIGLSLGRRLFRSNGSNGLTGTGLKRFSISSVRYIIAERVLCLVFIVSQPEAAISDRRKSLSFLFFYFLNIIFASLYSEEISCAFNRNLNIDWQTVPTGSECDWSYKSAKLGADFNALLSADKEMQKKLHPKKMQIWPIGSSERVLIVQ